MKGIRFSGAAKFLLLCAMALGGLGCLAIAGNTMLAPWSLYDRNRIALCLLTVAALAGILLLFRLSERLEAFFAAHERRALLGFALFFFAAQMLLAQALRFVPCTDVEQCFTAAQVLTDGGSLAEYERAWVYFTRYPHNLGIVYLLSGIFRFFGVFGWKDLFMQAVLVGSLLFVPGLLAGALVCRRIGGTRVEIRFLILMLTCLPMLYCTTEIYTDAFSLSFSAMIVYCAFRAREADGAKGRALWLLAMALCAFLGAQIRFPCVIAAIACLIWLFFDGAARPAAFGALLLAAVMLLGGAAVDHVNYTVLPKEDIAQRKLPKLHYIAMGLPIHEDDGYGDYGEGGWLIFSTSFDDPQERDRQLLEKVIDKVYFLRYPNRMANMLSRKMLCTFGDGTFGFGAVIASDVPEADNPVKTLVFPQGSLYGAYFHICTALFCAQLLLAAVASAQAVLRRDTRGAALLITLLGVFLFLAMWETRARYFFQFMEILLMAGAMVGGGRKSLTLEKNYAMSTSIH